MRSFPRARAMGEAVREVIARILIEEISDPRLEFVTVTGVEVSPDLGHANVYVTTGAEDYDEAIAGLDSAKGRIRSLLGQQIRARVTPELHFRIDPAIEEAARISEAIRAERASGRVSDDVENAGAPDDE